MTIFKWELVPSKLEAALMWRSTAPSSRPKVPGPGWEKAADYSDYCCPESGQAVALPTVSSPCLALFLHRSVKPLWGWTRASHAGHSAQWPAHGGHWVPGSCFFFFFLCHHHHHYHHLEIVTVQSQEHHQGSYFHFAGITRLEQNVTQLTAFLKLYIFQLTVTL